MTPTIETLLAPVPTDTIKLRASSVPRVLACPASLRIEGYNHSTGEATLGQAAHFAARRIVEGDSVEDAIVAALNAFSVERKQLERLVWGAWVLWETYQAYFPNAECEVTLPPLELVGADWKAEITGHDDITDVMPLESSGCALHIFDWKSDIASKGEGDHWPQLLTYGALAQQGIEDLSDGQFTIEDVKHVWIGVGYLGSREADGRKVSIDELAAFLDTVESAIDNSFWASPTPNIHCQYCPALLQCPATIAAITAFGEPEQEIVSPEQARRTLFSLKAVQAAVERVSDTLRSALRKGPMGLDENGVICLLPRLDDKIVTTPELLAKLSEDFSMAELCDVVSVSKSALSDAVKAKVEKDKGKAATAYMEELKALGCFEPKLVETMMVTTQEKYDAAVEKVATKRAEAAMPEMAAAKGDI